MSNLPAVSGGATGAPAAMSKADQAPILAAATMAAAPMPDAALTAMMQSMAGLSSGVMF